MLYLVAIIQFVHICVTYLVQILCCNKFGLGDNVVLVTEVNTLLGLLDTPNS